MSDIDFNNVGFGTLSIHAGQEPDKLYGALATPIYQTSTFCFETVEEGTAKFGGHIPGFCYSRGGNPTTVALEKKIAMLEVTYADTTNLKSVEAAIKENTKLIYFESLTNPTMELTDIAAISKLAHEKGILVAVDNIFTPPPEVYPLKEGADIVLHSCTKYINGHGDVISEQSLEVQN